LCVPFNKNTLLNSRNKNSTNLQLTHNAHPPQFNEGSYCEPNDPSDPPRTSKRKETRKKQSQKDGIKFELLYYILTNH
jgi:hypothetical protein